jgi:hypothetical protein
MNGEGFKCGHVAMELNDYKLSEAKKWSNRRSLFAMIVKIEAFFG